MLLMVTHYLYLTEILRGAISTVEIVRDRYYGFYQRGYIGIMKGIISVIIIIILDDSDVNSIILTFTSNIHLIHIQQSV